MNDNGDELLTTHQVAGIFQVSHATIWRWVRTGKLRAGKLGQWRFKRCDVDALIELESAKPAPPVKKRVQKRTKAHKSTAATA